MTQESARATEWLKCAGCGERFQARDNDWVALATGVYVHWGGRWGQDCHETYARVPGRLAANEARRVHEDPDEARRRKSQEQVDEVAARNFFG